LSASSWERSFRELVYLWRLPGIFPAEQPALPESDP
jgi:hypothetical protein